MEEPIKRQELIKEQESIKDQQPIKELHMLYISQMSVQERKAYEIAKEHLETSFNIDKSIGFIDWKKKKER